MQSKTILRLPQTITKTGFSRSTIYSKLNSDHPQYDHTFPKPIKLSARAMGWLESELDQWVADKAAARVTDTIKVNAACHVGRDAACKVRNKTKGD